MITRPFLSGAYLLPGVRPEAEPTGGGLALAALPVAQQEEQLVADLICVLSGAEGTHVRLVSPGGGGGGGGANAAASAEQTLAGLASLAAPLPRVKYCLPGADMEAAFSEQVGSRDVACMHTRMHACPARTRRLPSRSR